MHAITFALIASLGLLPVGAVWYLRFPKYSRRSYVGAGVFWVGVVAVLVFGITAGVAAGSSIACERKADDMRREWRYGLMAGCRVQSDDGQFVPIENLRIFNQEREG